MDSMHTLLRQVITISPAIRFRIAALSGFLAVFLGAFGAHGMRATLAALNSADAWNTASLYHLVHSVVLLYLAQGKSATLSYALFLAGIVFFSGSLYAYAATGYKPLTFLAPLGGLTLLLAWLSLLRASGEA